MLNFYDNGSRMSYVTWHLNPWNLNRTWSQPQNSGLNGDSTTTYYLEKATVGTWPELCILLIYHLSFEVIRLVQAT